MSDSTQGASGGGLVLLDEWRVQAFAAPDLSNDAARELGEQIDRDLSTWVAGLAERLRIGATLRVSIER